MITGKPAGWLEQIWYGRSPLYLALLPLAALFRVAVSIRRGLYRIGLLPSVRLSVPVIVVGNISVGGTGKTPLVLWLADFLQRRGRSPGIISRGYGGSIDQSVEVLAASDAALVGDEPLLLARKAGCPVWIGRDRVAAASALLQAHPECDVLLSDDGLQHYRLARDLELVVVDGERRFGNGCLLPAGPLREGLKRLHEVDAVVTNGGSAAPGEYGMRLQGERIYNLRQPGRSIEAKDLVGKKIHAVAGIGNPQRFFDHLKSLQLSFVPHAFPDHHAYQPGDLAFRDADVLLMTEKDAVKCADFADEKFWVMEVRAVLSPAFAELIEKKMRMTDGR